jgi:predicted RNase H-like nuclease
MPRGTSGQILVGLDGCRGGWLAVIQAGQTSPVARIFSSFAGLLESLPDTSIIGVDMPIGLATDGPRACDIEARSRLGERRSSVFPAPLRCCLVAASYAQACRLRMKAEGKRMSLQAYGILAKVREVDTAIRASGAMQRVIEVHPEVSFTIWNRGRPMGHAKRRPAGKAERLRLIEREWPGRLAAMRATLRGKNYAADDLHDAFAVLWSIRRWAQGSALLLGDRAKDDVGLPMRIVA